MLALFKIDMNQNKPIVCLVDDDEVYQYLSKKIINATQTVSELIQIDDADQTLNFLLENKQNADKLPDIIFLDINMPIMDGWQLIEELRPHLNDFAKKMMIFLCSSSNNPSDLIKAKDYLEVDSYIIKPLTESRYLDAMRQYENWKQKPSN